jgi:hypothetical protein
MCEIFWANVEDRTSPAACSGLIIARLYTLRAAIGLRFIKFQVLITSSKLYYYCV